MGLARYDVLRPPLNRLCVRGIVALRRNEPSEGLLSNDGAPCPELVAHGAHRFVFTKVPIPLDTS